MTRVNSDDFKSFKLYMYNFKTTLKVLNYIYIILRRLKAFKTLKTLIINIIIHLIINFKTNFH